MSNSDTKAVRTSARAANSVRDMIETEQEEISESVYTMKINVCPTGGYLHVPLSRKAEVLDYVSLALDVAGETLYTTKEWEDEYADLQKEIDDLNKLYDRIETL